jgi:hypothetical protein
MNAMWEPVIAGCVSSFVSSGSIAATGGANGTAALRSTTVNSRRIFRMCTSM